MVIVARAVMVAVTVAAETHDVRDRAAQAFGTWRTALGNALHRAGMGAVMADATAALLLSACEGAVVMSRAERDPGPFDTVAESLLTYTDQLVFAGRVEAPLAADQRQDPRTLNKGIS